MRLKLEVATAADALEIADLRNAVDDDLAARHGPGFGSGHCTAKGVLFDLRHAQVRVARHRGRVVATLVLATRKPWSINRAFFTSVKRPLYLTAIAVAPGRQRQGLGRQCLEAAARLARKFPADAIFLDVYDTASGAGDFYRKCGYREVGRATFRNAPLIYFELMF